MSITIAHLERGLKVLTDAAKPTKARIELAQMRGQALNDDDDAFIDQGGNLVDETLLVDRLRDEADFSSALQAVRASGKGDLINNLVDAASGRGELLAYLNNAAAITGSLPHPHSTNILPARPSTVAGSSSYAKPTNRSQQPGHKARPSGDTHANKFGTDIGASAFAGDTHHFSRERTVQPSSTTVKAGLSAALYTDIVRQCLAHMGQLEPTTLDGTQLVLLGATLRGLEIRAVSAREANLQALQKRNDTLHHEIARSMDRTDELVRAGEQAKREEERESDASERLLKRIGELKNDMNRQELEHRAATTSAAAAKGGLADARRRLEDAERQQWDAECQQLAAEKLAADSLRTAADVEAAALRDELQKLTEE